MSQETQYGVCDLLGSLLDDKMSGVLQDDELRPLQVLVEMPPVFQRDEDVVVTP